MSEQQKRMTLPEMLANVITFAVKTQEGAQAYLEALDSLPRPVVQVGKHYVTMDGSLVFVTKRITTCQCPCCGGEHRRGTVFSVLFGGGKSEEEPIEHTAPEDEPKIYEVVLLTGGHGVKSLPGHEPGQTMSIDDQGFMLFQCSPNIISDGNLAIAGMTLREMKELT